MTFKGFLLKLQLVVQANQAIAKPIPCRSFIFSIQLLQYIEFDCSKTDEEDQFVFIEDFEAPSDIRSKSILKDLVKDIQSESLPQTNKKSPYQSKANQKNSNTATSNRTSRNDSSVIPSERKNKRKPKNPNVKDKRESNK